MTETDSLNRIGHDDITSGENTADRPTSSQTHESAHPSAYQPAQEAYGTVSAAQAHNKPKHRAAVTVGALAICALVVACIVTYLYLSGAFNNQATSVQRVSLTEERVETALNEADITAPNLNDFAYVSQDTLVGPKFKEITLTEPVDLGSSNNQVIEAEATAIAVYKNNGVEISVPVTLPFEYSTEKETWIPGTPVCGTPTAQALASANANDITANLNDILTTADATYGESMKDASIVKTTSNLTIDGGTISLDLTKSVELEDKSTETRTSTVTLTVTWSETKGWEVTATHLGSIATDVTLAEPSVTTTAATSSTPIDIGTLNYGDEIDADGTIQAITDAKALSEANGYSSSATDENASGNVQLALKLNQPIDVVINNKSYRLTYLAIATSGVSDSTLTSLIGTRASITGTSEERFATSWTPIGIKTLEIETK